MLASPASRLALFLGRAVPSIATGFLVATISFVLGAAILGVTVEADEILGLCVAVIASSYACTAFGLSLGALGLRGRNISLFADTVGGCMLLVSGANVPIDRLPEWLQAIGSVLPLTHGIAAAREIADGASLAEAGNLIVTELLVGSSYLVIRLLLLRLFEYEVRRTATLNGSVSHAGRSSQTGRISSPPSHRCLCSRTCDAIGAPAGASSMMQIVTRRITISLDDTLERALDEAPRLLDLEDASESEKLRAFARLGYLHTLEEDLDDARLLTYRAWADDASLSRVAKAASRRAAARGVFDEG